MARVTEKELYALVQNLSDRTGQRFGPRMAYGRVGLDVYPSASSTGTRDISDLLTRPELLLFLRGMDEALHMVGK